MFLYVKCKVDYVKSLYYGTVTQRCSTNSTKFKKSVYGDEYFYGNIIKFFGTVSLGTNQSEVFWKQTSF